MGIGIKSITANPKMQCFTYTLLPLQILVYIFWNQGMIYSFLLPWGNNLFFSVVVFQFSLMWVSWWFHLVAHSFITVLTAFWLLKMERGYQKASQSLKASMTYAQGPITVGSFILTFISTLRKLFRNTTCCCLYTHICCCLERMFLMYNEYVI